MRPPGGIAAEIAPAKVNLTLQVGGRRPDGYHNIESLVVFAGESDALRLTPAASLSLAVEGPFVVQCGPAEKNLIVKAAHLLAQDVPGLALGHFELTKNLPAAAGLGGGSSDAAATLRLLARLNELSLHDGRLHAVAAAVGADVPVCLHPAPRIMRGVGDVLSEPLALPPLHAVLANPGIITATKDVFAAFDAMNADKAVEPTAAPLLEKLSETALIAWLSDHPNDLEPPAVKLHPEISDTLSALRAAPGCKLARMSGSGATCFGLFSEAGAEAAARTLARAHPGWWVRATTLGENLDGNSPA